MIGATAKASTVASTVVPTAACILILSVNLLSSYDPVQEIAIARCCTVSTLNEVKEYLLVGNEMLWFGNTLADSPINPN